MGNQQIDEFMRSVGIEPIEKEMYSPPVYEWMMDIFNRHVVPTLVPNTTIFNSDRALSVFAKKNKLFLYRAGYPNASSIRSPDGVYYVGFTPEMLLSLYQLAFLYTVLLEGDAEGPLSAVSIRIGDGSFYNYDHILGPKAKVITDNKGKLNLPAYFPNIPEREGYRALAVILFDFALAFVTLHERAHVLGGHLDYKLKREGDYRLAGLSETPVTKNVSISYSEETNLEPLCLELMADFVAGQELLVRNTQKSIWSLYKYCPHPKNRKEVFYLSTAMIIVTMSVLKKLEMIKGLSPLYPSVEERIAETVLTLANCYQETEDDVRGIIGGVMQAKQFLDRMPGQYLPSFSFDPQDGFTALTPDRLSRLNTVIYDVLQPKLLKTIHEVFHTQ